MVLKKKAKKKTKTRAKAGAKGGSKKKAAPKTRHFTHEKRPKRSLDGTTVAERKRANKKKA